MAASAPIPDPSPLKASDLEPFELLRHLPADELDELIARSRLVTLRAGEPVPGAGSERCMVLLLAGKLCVPAGSAPGAPFPALLPGAVAGELALLDAQSVCPAIEASEPSRVLLVSEEGFWHLLGSSHAFALNLLLRLAQQLANGGGGLAEQAALRERFERAALFDPPTNLHNRRWLEGALPRIVERHAMDGKPMALALLEIDDLAEREGTGGADPLLAAVSITLRSRLRPTDYVARLSGSCFALILPSTPLAVAQSAAERIRDAIRATRPRTAAADFRPLTASLGLAALEPAQSASALLARAEAALHRARQTRS
jgi:diguanylate cyclase (GGDEF)-like protein